MSFTFVRKLPTPDEIREQYPVPAHLAAKKRNGTLRYATSSQAEAINCSSS